jgi:hypothetical protein
VATAGRDQATGLRAKNCQFPRFGFARPVRAEQGEHGVRGDGEVNPVEHWLAAEGLAEAGNRAAAKAAEAGQPLDPTLAFSYEALLRELVDQKTYPHLHRLAWSGDPDEHLDDRDEFRS